MYAFVPAIETKPLWDLAEQFTFGDRMFQSNQGPTYPAHQFIIGGTSAPSAGSVLLASENPGDATHTRPQGGCDSPPDMLVDMIDPSGSEKQQLYPCFEHQTLLDLLDARHVSWTYYEPRHGGFWDGPASIRHIRDAPVDWARVVTPETTVLDDIAAGELAQVTWVIPNGLNSDHPGNLMSSGPSWVASITNAVGASQYWKSTAIFITWDDWGGWYDHVPPPIYGSYELGFRVPLIVVSPYAKRGYVSHRQHEFGSILKFVEENWSLGSLGQTDARSDDLADCFDFSQAPTRYDPVAAKYPLKHFTQSPVAFTPPDNQ
jgi:phospholipase C